MEESEIKNQFEEIDIAYPKVKKCTYKDRKILSNLIKDFVKKSGKDPLVNMVPGVETEGNQSDKKNNEENYKKENDEKIYELIENVFTNLIDWVNEDLIKWFMQMTNTETIEQFEEYPCDIEIYIYKELMKQKGFKNFFELVSGRFKTIRDLINRLLT